MKKQRIEFRVSILEKRLIEKNAKSTGQPVSEFIRQSALNQKPKYRLTEDEISIFKMLHTYAINFKNIANMYKSKNPYINQEVRFVAEEIKKQLKKFQ